MGRYCSHIGCVNYLMSLRDSVLASEGKRAMASDESTLLHPTPLVYKSPIDGKQYQQILGIVRASTLALKSVEGPLVQALKFRIDCKLNVIEWQSVCCKKFLPKVCTSCPSNW